MIQFKKILNALESNKLVYDGEFRSILSRGFASDDCQELSDEVLSDLQMLLIVGVNNGGFNTAMKGAIKELTALAVKLSDRKSAAKVEKLRLARQNIMDNLVIKEEGVDTMTIKEEINKYLDTSLKGAKFLLAFDKDETQKEHVERSIALLEQMKQVVEEAWDNTSKTAADYASNMIDGIIAWRDQVSVYTCDSTGVEALEEALKQAEKWGALTEAPLKKNIANEQYLKDNIAYIPDSIDRMIKSGRSIEQIGTFRRSLRRFDEDTNARYNTEKMETELDAVRAKLEERKKQAVSINIQLKSGDMSAETAALRLKQIKIEVQDLKDDISDREKELVNAVSTRSNRMGISKEFERLNKKLEDFTTDPAMLATLAANIDFVELSRVLLGRVGQQDMKVVVNKILKVFDTISMQGEFTEESREAWHDIRAELNLEQKEHVSRRVTSQQKTEQDYNNEVNDLLADLGILDEEEPVEEPTEQVAVRKISHLTDDDN